MANTKASGHSMQGVCDVPIIIPPSSSPSRIWPSPLVILSACLVLLGSGGPLLLRVYFVHGGHRLWLSTFTQLSGWPLLLPPICVLLFRSRRRCAGSVADHLLPPRLAGAIAVLGSLFGVACFVYSLGVQALPLSTSSLLTSTQLAFNAVFAFLFAGLRFTPFSANAVVLLTIGPAVLGFGPSSSGPKRIGGESRSREYWIGFVEAIAAAALMGLVFPLVEAALSRYGRRNNNGPASAGKTAMPPRTPSYVMVMQIQATMGCAGSMVCLLGMAIKGDFHAVQNEAAGFGLGEAKYFVVLVFEAVSWQLFNLGVMGLILCASSLLAGIMVAVVLPLSQVLAVIFLHEKFDGTKGIALVLSLWGFVSYVYGENAKKKREAAKASTQTQQLLANNTSSRITNADLESASSCVG